MAVELECPKCRGIFALECPEDYPKSSYLCWDCGHQRGALLTCDGWEPSDVIWEEGSKPPTDEEKALEEDADICGLCGEPGADKMPAPCHWPGEIVPDTEYIHPECETAEQKRAHAELSPEERAAFLRTIN
jgi:hypothetical protein